MNRTIITVDGLAGSGKTTLARALAGQLGFAHLNSGLLYRAVGWVAENCCAAVEDPDQIAKEVGRHALALKLSACGSAEMFIDGVNRTIELQSHVLSERASKLAALPGIRSILLALQREAFQPLNLVAEGRDMGTVVFPEAVLKFFITATERVRAERRAAQGRGERGEFLTEEQLIREISERDRRDSSRQISPTVPASDAIIIDNSMEGLTSILERMYTAALEKGIVPKSRD